VDAVATTTPYRVTNVRFREGSIRGTLVPAEAAETPSERRPARIAVNFDGERVSDVELRWKGGGAEGLFTWFVYPHLYDDASHVITFALENEPATSLEAKNNKIAVRLEAANAPQLTAQAWIDADGTVSGYAYDAANPSSKLQVEVWEHGRLVSNLDSHMDEPETGMETDRPVTFSYSPDSISPWLIDQGALIVPKFGQRIECDTRPLTQSFDIKSVSVDETLVVQATTSPHFSRLPITCEVDGARAHARIRRGVNTVDIRIAKPERPDAKPHVLTLTVVLDGTVLTQSRRTFFWRTNQSLISNADFRDWDGASPLDWTLAPGCQARPAIDGQTTAGANTHIVIEVAEGGGLSLLSRELPEEVSGLGEVEVALEIRSRDDLPIAASITDVEGPLATAELHIGPDWTQHRDRLTFTRAPIGPLQLSLRSASAAAASVELAYIDLGAPGFVRGQGIEQTGAAAIEAVRNTDFARWPRSLTLDVDGGAKEGPSGWFIRSNDANTGVRARLAEGRGPDGSVIYGTALTGELQERFAAVSTKVATTTLARMRTAQLTIEAMLTTAAFPTEAPSQISRVCLHVAGSDAPEDRVVLASNLMLTSQLQTYVINLSEAQIEQVAALCARPDVGGALYLSLQVFRRRLDLFLKRVSFAEAEGDGADHQPFTAFEDYNLIAQLSRISGIDDWRSTDRPRLARAPEEVSIEPAIATWRASALPMVDIVIPVHNAEVEVVKCLTSLLAHTTLPHRLIIVDDASAPPTARALAAFAEGKPWVTLITNADNRGYTASCNIGLSNSTAPWLMLLNSDTMVTESWLEGLMSLAVSDETIGMVGPLSNAATYQSLPEIRDARGQWMVNDVPNGFTLAAWAALVRDLSLREHPDVPLLNGFCTLIRREALDAIGVLDEETFPVGYGEEVDLCLRMGKAGYRLVVADDVFIYHHKSSSFGKERRATLAKQGGVAVRKKHSDVDIGALEKQMLAPSLAMLRDRLRARLDAAA
jgi:GT2 family glycosyltransferase